MKKQTRTYPKEEPTDCLLCKHVKVDDKYKELIRCKFRLVPNVNCLTNKIKCINYEVSNNKSSHTL